MPIQPLTQSDQGLATEEREPVADVSLTSDGATAPVEDSGHGPILFVGFVAAVLFMTGAVAFLALFTAWWVLGLVFGVDLLVTSVVGTSVFATLSDAKLGHQDEDRGQLGLAASPGGPVQSRATKHASPAAA